MTFFSFNIGCREFPEKGDEKSENALQRGLLGAFLIIVLGSIFPVYAQVIDTESIGQGSGLAASYYQGTNFDRLVKTQLDPVIKFNWESNATQNFSVRWLGSIVPKTNGIYNLSTITAGGVRLWMDGELLIDNFTRHELTTNSATVSMGSGERHQLIMEYYQSEGEAVAWLLWQEKGAREIIPTALLYPDFTPLPLTPATNFIIQGRSAAAIAFSWDPVPGASGAVSYDILMGGNSVGSTKATSFTLGDLTANTPYTFTLRTRDDRGVADADPIKILTATNSIIPLPWQTADLGSVSRAGSAYFESDSTLVPLPQWTVTGSGNDIGAREDHFRYTFQSLRGDGALIARLASQTVTDPWAKAGIMVRNSMTTGSPFSFVAWTPGNGVILEQRDLPGGLCISTNQAEMMQVRRGNGLPQSVERAPIWLELLRSGGVISGYYSQDGINWNLLGSCSMTNSNTLMGLAVTSHNNKELSSGIFDHVTLDTPPTLTITSPGNNMLIPIPSTDSAGQITVEVTNTTAPIAKVEIFDGETKIGEATNAPYVIGWTTFTDGHHTLVAKATDIYGLSATSSAVNVSMISNSVGHAPVRTNAIVLQAPAQSTIKSTPPETINSSELREPKVASAKAASPIKLIAGPNGTTGVGLWFKAKEIYGWVNVNDVNQWNSSSTNVSVYQSFLSSSNCPKRVDSSINGLPNVIVRFNGNQWLSKPTALFGTNFNSGMTMFVVGCTTNRLATQYPIFLGEAKTGMGRGIGYAGGNQLMSTFGITAMGTPAPTNKVFTDEAVVLSQSKTNVSFYRNGVMMTNSRIAGVGKLQKGIYIGTAANGTGHFQGDLAEIIVYNRELTSNEMTAVNTYLVSKYHLDPMPTIKVDASNPIIPSSSITAPQTIAFTGATADQQIRYTLNGLSPTASSPIYTNPLVLTTNTLLSTALFSGTNQLSPIATNYSLCMYSWLAHYFGTSNIGYQLTDLAPAGDGRTIYQEFLLGYDPNDYYHGVAPTLTFVQGASQIIGTNVVTSLRVLVNGGATNAPFTLTVQSGQALISSADLATGAGTTSPKTTTLQLRTNRYSNYRDLAGNIYAVAIVNVYSPNQADTSTIEAQATAGEGNAQVSKQVTTSLYTVLSDPSLTAPSNLKVISISSSSVQLTYTPAYNNQPTTIQESIDDGSTWSLVEIDPSEGMGSGTPVPVTSIVNNLPTNQIIHFRVTTGDATKGVIGGSITTP